MEKHVKRIFFERKEKKKKSHKKTQTINKKNKFNRPWTSSNVEQCCSFHANEIFCVNFLYSSVNSSNLSVKFVNLFDPNASPLSRKSLYTCQSSSFISILKNPISFMKYQCIYHQYNHIARFPPLAHKTLLLFSIHFSR